MNIPLFEELDALMSSISERAFCSQWQVDLEFDLWHLLQSGERSLGQVELSDDEIQRLKGLSKALDGWIVFDEVRFLVPLANWQEGYRRFEAGEKSAAILDDLRKVGAVVPFAK